MQKQGSKSMKRVWALACMLALVVSLLGGYYAPTNVKAGITQVNKLSHTMATSTDFDDVKDQYIPRFNEKDGVDDVKNITYDSASQSMKFTITGWYNSAGGKVDITQAMADVITEAKTLDEDVTIGVSMDLKGGGREGGFGLLMDSATNLDVAYVDSTFETFRKEMTIQEFESAYSGYTKLYAGFWSGNPDIFVKNVCVYYFTGQREAPIEMEETTTIPDGNVGFAYHDLGSQNGDLKNYYVPYKSGILSNTTAGLKLTATTNAPDNGFALDITDSVKKGKSGDVFGASLRMRVDEWTSAESEQAQLFFEVRNASNQVTAKIPMATVGPNAERTNVTNSTSEVGEGWLTKLVTGEAAIPFGATDKIYLCTNQSGKVQYIDDVCLWGNIDTYQEASSIEVNTPTLNQTAGTLDFTVSNLTERNQSLVIETKHYNGTEIQKVDEYKLELLSGTEETKISLPATVDTRLSIKDSDGNVYQAENQVGTNVWIGTWSSAQLTASGDTAPPAMGLTNNTYRQMIRVSTGGTRLRFTLTNEYGATPLEVRSAHIAKQVATDTSEIDSSTDQVLTFNGSESITIPAGGKVTSDAVDFFVKPLERVALSMYFGQTPAKVTSHTGARCNNYLTLGNHVSDVVLGASSKTISWYFLADVDVMSPATNKAIVCFGDSITDGYGVELNKYQRWSDVLATKLQANAAMKNYSVLNEGIGGNAIFGGLGTAAKDRFDRDVINQDGADTLIILMGINDIGGSSDTTLPERMIAQYKTMLTKAKAKGMTVYMGTILPFKGNSYYSPNEGVIREQMRQTVNNWIKSAEAKTAGVDYVIDFAALMCASNDSSTMATQYKNDGLHPNVTGYAKMGEIVYNALCQH